MKKERLAPIARAPKHERVYPSPVARVRSSSWRELGWLLSSVVLIATDHDVPWQFRALLISIGAIGIGAVFFENWKKTRDGALRISRIEEMEPGMWKSFLEIALTRPVGFDFERRTFGDRNANRGK